MNKDWPVERLSDRFEKKKSEYWENERKTRALELFHRAARDVPAYRDFLGKNRVSALKIKTFEDFQYVPPINKKNYLRKYPPEKLIWGGKFSNDA